MEEFDFEADELADIVGVHWAGVVWGCPFEDLLARTIQTGDRNIVDDYILRRGLKSSGWTEIYQRTLRTSENSLNKERVVHPGSGIMLHYTIKAADKRTR